jgi:hypothetical protein
LRKGLSALADQLDVIADGGQENIHALRAAELVRDLEPKHQLCARRWAAGVADWKDVSGLRRVARRLRELDPEYGVDEMVVKERFGIQLKNGRFAMDEETNSPKIFTTKRAAHLAYGADADVQAMRCTFEVIVKAKQSKKKA